MSPTGRPAVAALALVVLCASAADAQIVADGSFETPALAPNAYAYRPGGSAWSFVGNAGLVNGAGSDFNTPSAAPDGAQVAFLQTGADPGRLVQTIALPTAGTYRLTFRDAGRSSAFFGGNTTFDVLLDAAVLATRTTTTGQPYTARTVDFAAGAGQYALAFALRAGTGDNTAFVDAVEVALVRPSVVPEPGTWALVGGGLAALAAVRRRGRRRAAAP